MNEADLKTTDYGALTAAAYGFGQGVKKGRQDAEAELIEARQRAEEWAHRAGLAEGRNLRLEAALQGIRSDAQGIIDGNPGSFDGPLHEIVKMIDKALAAAPSRSRRAGMSREIVEELRAGLRKSSRGER